jgi:hypothetical protein
MRLVVHTGERIDEVPLDWPKPISRPNEIPNPHSLRTHNVLAPGTREADYKIASNLITRELFLFAHLSGTDWDWVCELTSKRIQASERVAARPIESP